MLAYVSVRLINSGYIIEGNLIMILKRYVSPCLLFLIFAMGCNQQTPQFTRVTGQVTVDGKPVTAGRVCFVTTDKSSSMTAELSAEGKYILNDCPNGEVRVAVMTKDYAIMRGPPTKVRIKAGDSDKDGKDEYVPSTRPNPHYVPTPSKYESFETSGLRTKIPQTSDEHTYNIELTSK